MRWYRDRGDLIGFITYVVLGAPDHFRYRDYLAPDQQMNLDRAFEELRDGLARVAKEIGDAFPTDRYQAMLDEAYKHYREGRAKEGAWKLQDIQDELQSME